jgi:uncharacterized protein (TIGR00251 family)
MTFGDDYTLPILRAVGEGVSLKIHVVPGASRDRVAGLHGEALKVTVQAPPERGKANARLLRLLATRLGIRAADVRLERGETSREKTVLLVGWSLERAQEEIRKLLP